MKESIQERNPPKERLWILKIWWKRRELIQVKSPIHASIAMKNQTVHEGIKPFHCNICDYKSSVKSSLKTLRSCSWRNFEILLLEIKFWLLLSRNLYYFVTSYFFQIFLHFISLVGINSPSVQASLRYNFSAYKK